MRPASTAVEVQNPTPLTFTVVLPSVVDSVNAELVTVIVSVATGAVIGAAAEMVPVPTTHD